MEQTKFMLAATSVLYTSDNDWFRTMGHLWMFAHAVMPIHSMRGDYLDRSDANTSKFMRFTISNVRQGDKILW